MQPHGAEDDQLQAVSITALTHFANPQALIQDDELTRRIEQLRIQSRSREVQQATVSYLSRRST